jgi:hypothetical protein
MTKETAKTAPPLDVAALCHPGSFSEQVELQLGLLTQGVTECMMLATGAFPGLTEEEEPEAPAWGHRRPKTPTASWATVRSGQLRDAARLSEASARLLTGLAKVQAQRGQRFTVRHTDRNDGTKNRRRVTTITHSFHVPFADSTDLSLEKAPADGQDRAARETAQ